MFVNDVALISTTPTGPTNQTSHLEQSLYLDRYTLVLCIPSVAEFTATLCVDVLKG